MHTLMIINSNPIEDWEEVATLLLEGDYTKYNDKMIGEDNFSREDEDAFWNLYDNWKKYEVKRPIKISDLPPDTVIVLTAYQL